jgi:hypothetical protein
VHRPNDTVDVGSDVEEHCRVGKALDGSLRGASDGRSN